MNKKQKSVLIVDDESDLLEIISDKFQEDGWIVYCAESADKAEVILKNEIVDVVISDYQMPEKNGIDFFKDVINQKLIKGENFIFISGYVKDFLSNFSNYKKIEKHFFIKPFKIPDLIAAANKLVN